MKSLRQASRLQIQVRVDIAVLKLNFAGQEAGNTSRVFIL